MDRVVVKTLPSLVRGDVLLRLQHSEANFLNGLEADEREWLIAMEREVEHRLDDLVLRGARVASPGTSCHCWIVEGERVVRHADWCPCS